MIKRKTYQKCLLTGLLLIAFGFTALAQTTLADINQSLRYSRYSRLALKVIPIQETERKFTLQMVAEKLEENPQFDDYLFSYCILSRFDEPIVDEKIIPLEESRLKYDTDNHYYFEEEV